MVGRYNDITIVIDDFSIKLNLYRIANQKRKGETTRERRKEIVVSVQVSSFETMNLPTREKEREKRIGEAKRSAIFSHKYRDTLETLPSRRRQQ